MRQRGESAYEAMLTRDARAGACASCFFVLHRACDGSDINLAGRCL